MANAPVEEMNTNGVPGLVLTHQDSNKKFDPIHDKDLLEARIEARLDKEVEKIEFSEDNLKAYVEFKDTEDLRNLLNMDLVLRKREQPLRKTEINLLEIRRSYLVVKNLESFMDKDTLTFHFEGETKEHITSIEFSDDHTSAEVHFLNPKAALKMDKQTSIVGCTVNLEVKYEIPHSSNDAEVLVLLISNLPVDKIPEEKMITLLKKYFENNTENEIEDLILEGAKAYITFKEASAVNDIIGNKPTAPFIGGICLNISAVPISKLPMNKEESINELNMPTIPQVEGTTGEGETIEMDQELLQTSHGQKDHMLQISEESSIPFKIPSLLPNELISQSVTPVKEHQLLNEDGELEQQGLESDPQSPLWLSSNSVKQLPMQPPCTPRQIMQQPPKQSLMLSPQQFPVPVNQQLTSDMSLHSAQVLQMQSIPSQQTMNPLQPAMLDSLKVDSLPHFEGSSLKVNQASKILIEDVPAIKRDEAHIKEYLNTLMSVPCSVKQYQEKFFVEFSEHIDVELLKLKAKQHTFECVQLSIFKLEPSSFLLVANLDSTIRDGYLKLFFERHAGNQSITSIKRSQCRTEALIQFTNPEVVQTVLSKPDCHNLDDCMMRLSEYFTFMPFDVIQKEKQPSPPSPIEETYSWNQVEIELTLFESQWFEGNLTVVSEKLLLLQAQCRLASIDSLSTLNIIPLEGSQKMNNWEARVRSSVQEVKSDLAETSFPFSENLKGEIIQKAYSAYSKDLIVKAQDNSIIIFGYRSKVDKLESELKDYVAEVCISTEERVCSGRHVKFLKAFSTDKLNTVKTEEFKFVDMEQKLIVKGNRKSREQFWSIVDSEIDAIREKHIVLKHPNLCLLLNSEKGIKKIEEVIHIASPNITCYLESSSGQFLLYFMCHKTIDDDKLSQTKKHFKKLLDISELSINRTQLEVCTTKDKWKIFVQNLVKEPFMHIDVDSSNCRIVIVGEKIALNDVSEKIKNYLDDECSIEISVNLFSFHEWKVISSHYKNKLTAIQQDCKKKVKITYPQKLIPDEPVSITLRGDPTPVDNVRTRLELLKSDVHHKNDRITNLPAARQLVESIQDKVKIMEQESHTSIAISVKAIPTITPSPSHKVAMQTKKAFSVILANDVRLTAYIGNFTQNAHNVDTIINFVSTEPSTSDANLGLLFSTSEGHVLKEEFQSSKDSMLSVDAGHIMKMRQNDGLKCTNLWHLFNYPWNGGHSGEDYYLGHCIERATAETIDSVSILFSSPCTKPLEYPAELFARKLNLHLSSVTRDLNVTVYLNNSSDADKFHDEFEKSKGCRILPGIGAGKQVSPTFQSRRSSVAEQRSLPSTQSSSSPLEQVISVENKSLTDSMADVYVNSTNKELKLTQGLVSNILLKKCGDQLQQECNQCAPLHLGEVAVSGAYNLQCKLIFHVNLPNYRDPSALQIFRKTIKAILGKAKEKSIESIAIPSLGVGNLKYPPNVSANAIFDEIMEFLKANPKSKTKYILVIYESKVFDEFQKVYQQKISIPWSQMAVAPDIGTKEVGSTVLNIVNSDIAEEDCDAIVNTTTTNFAKTGTAVSQAIMRKGGTRFQQHCEQLVSEGKSLKLGSIIMTTAAGQLNCKIVIHANVPVKGYYDPFELVHKIVTDSLQESEKLGLTSIAFPAFGLGKGQYSVDEIARPMLSACLDFGKTYPKSIKQIKIVIYDSSLHGEFYDHFLQFFGLEKSHGLSSYLPKFLGGTSSNKSVNLQDPNMIGSGNYHSKTNLSVCFDIYGPTLTTCSNIATKLRQLIKEKYLEQPLEHPAIAILSDCDKKRIEKLGMDKVKISIIKGIKKIVLNGPKMEVIDVKGKINEILNELQKIHDTLQLIQWKSCSVDNEVEQYSYEVSCELEQALLNGKDRIIVVIDNMKSTVDLKKMEETCLNSGTIRKVVREEKPQVPSTWVSQTKGSYQYEVQKDSPEYQKALADFHATIKHNVNIVKLERIQNPTDYFNYRSRLELIKRKYPHKNVEVKILFHGSKEESISSIITTGFNRNFAADANAAVFGCGTYFALHAEYSAKDIYSAPNSDGTKFMFICSVVIGEYTKGNRQMKLAPSLPNDSRSTYDTLVNDKDNPTIFVAMSDGQAYPDYLVSFKIV